MRTPREILGDDAFVQLVFEGYKVVVDEDAIKVGAHVAENGDGRWQGVVTRIQRINGGIASPGIATCDPGKGKPSQWNLSRLILCTKPDWVDWEMPDTMEPLSDD